MPSWLPAAAVVAGFVSALIITIDLLRRPQPMAIMNVVWPVTALFGSVLVLGQYFGFGRAGRPETGFAVAVANGTLHCGSGCALGDICAEFLAFFIPAVATWVGWHSLFDNKMFAVWVLDYLFAYAFGIVFQYFSIAPMRGLSLRDGLIAAIKADTLSLTAWQIGMYGFMAIADNGRQPDTWAFWFLMQIAMLCGFVTAYPVNWWLIRSGVKERM